MKTGYIKKGLFRNLSRIRFINNPFSCVTNRRADLTFFDLLYLRTGEGSTFSKKEKGRGSPNAARGVWGFPKVDRKRRLE